MFGSRRHARYPVNLRLRLQLPDGELETTTEDVSHAGFSAPCPRLPEEGSSFGFTVTLPDGREVKGTGSAMRVSGELAGFSCEFAADAQAAWDAFLAQEQGSGGVWRMLSRYARSESDTGRAIVEKGRFEALFQREQASAVRLHMVGENGEAYRVAFEKDPGSPLEESPFEIVKRAASRMLSRDVFLRRSPGGTIEALRVVELKRGGFAYVVQQANGKASLMGLHGSELMVIEVDGSAVFPHFTVEELERIAADTFRREVEPATPTSSPSSVIHDGFAREYAHAVVSSRPAAATFEEVRAAMAASQRVQERTYGTRTLRLFPDVWLSAYATETSDTKPLRGFAVEDGSALCLFALAGPGAPRVVRLNDGDYVAIIREA